MTDLIGELLAERYGPHTAEPRPEPDTPEVQARRRRELVEAMRSHPLDRDRRLAAAIRRYEEAG